jgi:hypothetical protein
MIADSPMDHRASRIPAQAPPARKRKRGRFGDGEPEFSGDRLLLHR